MKRGVVGLACRAGLAVDAHGAGHTGRVRRLEEEEAARPQRRGAAPHDVVQLACILGVMDRPGEGADDVVGTRLRQVLHPLEPHPPRAEAGCRDLDHSRRGICSVRVEPRRKRLSRNAPVPQPTSNSRPPGATAAA
jgi:hypothetical protein